MADSASSSSFNYGFTYDVFISFRGLDTRHGFTGNLYKALVNRGIHTFIDDEELQRGQEITPSLLKAIEESRIAIIVLSKNYASSSFCLDELVKILDYINGKGDRLVWPIFYCVDPSDVRKQTGTYGEALSIHKERFGDHNERLQKWRMALQQVANLSGWHFKLGDGYEYEFIEKIVERVSRKIKHAALPIADYPVGLESQVSKVNSLLDVGSDGVHMLGIYGIGGIGKTTLALAVYNLIADQFEGVCFLENVRENSNKYGLQYLQEILLTEIVGEKKIKITSVRQGISIIQHRLQQKKVLLILDDVDKIEQLEAIIGGSKWLGFGSRVIITTRDKHLLSLHGVNKTYKVKKLNKKDALQLLTWKAFKMEKVDSSYMDVLDQAVTYASGLPLALVIIGSNLFGKNIEEWKSLLRQYESIPNKEIQEILKVSFNALQENEQSVFLDIACFYKGKVITLVEHMLRAHYGDCMKYHIGVLVEKSLIKISWPPIVTLHDLIEDMGKEIVRQESPKDPGKRSRLWYHKDIVQILEENTGTRAIEMIYLEFLCSENVVELDEMAFKKMKNLKTLIIKDGYFTKGPKHLPNSLRVLEWWRYPLEYLPSKFDPKKLSIFNLPKSCLTSVQLVDSIKKFVNVRDLNFDDTECLTQIPDVSSLPNLEIFSFQNCQNLITIHNSIGFLDKLKILSAVGCRKLRSFPAIKLISLEQLNLSFCSSLHSFPEILGKMENITDLVLDETPIKELPCSFQNLACLQTLQIRLCGMLKLPSSIVMMPKLIEIIAWDGWLFPNQNRGEENVSSMVPSNVECLRLYHCNLSDDFFSIGLKWFANLKELMLPRNNITILPECIKEFRFLKSICLDYCPHLREIRGLPPNLEIFLARHCKSLTRTNMLLNQELHEAGNTMFYFPGARMPNFFEHQSKEGSVSFWFRNKFPALALCLITGPMCCEAVATTIVIINSNERILDFRNTYLSIEAGHTYLFDFQMIKFEDNLDEVLLENEWNHVEITYWDANKIPILKEIGIHVFKQKSSMQDVRFTDPYRKRKLDDDLDQ